MFSFCWVFFNYFWSQITKIKKYILHLIIGKSEIERILFQKKSKKATAEFGNFIIFFKKNFNVEQSISSSIQLSKLQNQEKKLNFKKFTRKDILDEITNTKKIKK